MAPSRTHDGMNYFPIGSDALSSKHDLVSISAIPVIDEEVHEPQAWKGSELSESDYVVEMTAAEEKEVVQAAMHFISSEKAMSLICPDTFPLPTLGPRLVSLKARLYEGLGFFLLRGLKPANYDSTMHIAIFLGISSYLGNKRAIQYPGGPVLAHVIDLSHKEDEEKHRGQWLGAGNKNTPIVSSAHCLQLKVTDHPEPFHTDLGHLLCLYNIHSVASGGRSRLASSRAIIETLQSERPDIVDILMQDWQWDNLAEDPTWTFRPLLFQENGRHILGYSRRPLLGCPDFPRRSALEPLSAIQKETMEVLESMADRFALNFDFRSGDIQYINNLAILHAREGFDHERSPGCRRHLLRISIKDEKQEFSLPEKLGCILDPMYDHNVGDETFPWNLGPLPYSLPP